MQTLTKRTHASNNTSAIDTIFNKRGEMMFRMGLTHLFDIGITKASEITDEDVKETLRALIEKDEELKKQKRFSIMTPQFQVDIIETARELAQFSIWTLLKYVQNYIFIDIV